jgi:hypothetical protein
MMSMVATPSISTSTSGTNAQTITNTQSTYNTLSQNTVETTHSHTHPSHTKQLQPTITPTKHNNPFGDLITSPKTPNSVRIFFQNVNGMHKGKSWHELASFSKKINTLGVDLFGAAETNIKWNFTRNQQAKAILHKHHKTCSITTSSNREECFTAYQPGGTLTSVLNKFVGRIQTCIHDPSSLGRWSGFKLNTNFGHQLNFITVYQPTKSDGLHTTYQQHVHYYRTQGIPHPDPRKWLIQDLEKLILDFNNNKEETIILIDANDGIHQKNSLLPSFLSNTNLVSLIPNTPHHPPTHSRGSQCIDFWTTSMPPGSQHGTTIPGRTPTIVTYLLTSTNSACLGHP